MPPDVGGVNVEGGVVELVLVVVMDVGLLAADFLSDVDVWVGVVGATAAAAAASCFLVFISTRAEVWSTVTLSTIHYCKPLFNRLKQDNPDCDDRP